MLQRLWSYFAVGYCAGLLALLTVQGLSFLTDHPTQLLYFLKTGEVIWSDWLGLILFAVGWCIVHLFLDWANTQNVKVLQSEWRASRWLSRGVFSSRP